MARAKNAILINPSVSKKSSNIDIGAKGLLIVTNFRVSFLSPHDKSTEVMIFYLFFLYIIEINEYILKIN